MRRFRQTFVNAQQSYSAPLCRGHVSLDPGLNT